MIVLIGLVVIEALAVLGLAVWVMRERQAKEQLAGDLRGEKAQVAFFAFVLRAAQEKLTRIESAMPPVFPCGCSRNRVIAGLCDAYAANGEPRPDDVSLKRGAA